MEASVAFFFKCSKIIICESWVEIPIKNSNKNSLTDYCVVLFVLSFLLFCVLYCGGGGGGGGRGGNPGEKSTGEERVESGIPAKVAGKNVSTLRNMLQ